MHVIALENYPSALRGGQELNLLEICHGLSKRGHRITLLYVDEGNLLDRYREFCDRVININSFLIDRSRMADFFSFLTDIWKVPGGKNSIVFTNRYHDVLFGSALAFFQQISHACFLQLPPIEHGFPRPLTIGFKGVKQFITLSEQSKLDWVKSGFPQDKIVCVHGGTNTEIFKPTHNFSQLRQEWNIPETTKVVSFVGRLDREKGLETLIKGFNLLYKSDVNAKLLIAGKPLSQGSEYKTSLEQLVHDLEIADAVEFIGHVANTTAVYQVSDVSVLPSLWSEPFGRSVTESMACGTPVVASRTGGIKEILTGEFQDRLFEPGNECELATALKQIIYWRSQQPTLGDRCRNHVLSHFTLEHMVEGIEQVLLQII